MLATDNRSRSGSLLQPGSWGQGEPNIDLATRLITRENSVDTTFTPIITTKVIAPAPAAAQIARPRLTNRLHEGVAHALTLVVAPAGYGKTALLSEWAQQSTAPIAWLSLDASDGEPYQFWAYVIAALDTAQPGLGGQVHALLPEPEASIEQVLAALINVLNRSEPFTLVLDNYHTIVADEVHLSLAFLLDHMPSTFHIVLAGRAEPPLPLARWRLANMLNELHVGDLCFTQSEAASLLGQALGQPPARELVATLADRTEGWAAGLRLAAHFAATHGIAEVMSHFGGAHRDIQDYLEEEVLGPLPADLQAFLLQTSVLDRLCGPLCDTILHGEHQTLRVGDGPLVPHFSQFSARHAFLFDAYNQISLAGLERAGLFLIPLDTERTWYRYHPLFAEALRYRLEQEAPALAAALRQRAEAWYAEHGMATGTPASTATGATLPSLAGSRPQINPPSLDLGLSSREQDVLRLLVEGCSNQDIAATLIIGVNTVKMHIKHLYAKLDAHNRTQAVAHARKLGLV